MPGTILRALADRGQSEEAIADFEKAVKFDPDFLMARNDLGVALARRGQLDEAMVQFRRVLETQPAYADALANLGNALARKGGWMRPSPSTNRR